MDSPLLELQNPWWSDPALIEKDQHLVAVEGKSYFFVPALVHEVTFNAGDISVIRGPRQAGKTTAIKMMIRNLLQEGVSPRSVFYLSCEVITSFRELQEILIGYLKDRGEHCFLFLDEISFVADWQRTILAVANMGLNQKAVLVLTGSNARDLKESSERLPGRRGRGKDLKLFPLGLLEMSRLPCFREKTFHDLLEIYNHVGGFPRAIADFVTGECVTDMTYEIYRNWVIGDASRYGFQQETLKQILFRVAETTGSRVTWPKLIENSPVKSHETALQYVEHLQDSFLCRIHHCYDPDLKGPSFQKARKIYFIDPLLDAVAFCWREGLPNIFQWVKTRLQDTKFAGRVFEQTVINHAGRGRFPIFYWYSAKHKKEVDLVIREEKELKLYEVKLSRSKPFKAFNQNVSIIDPLSFHDFLGHINLV